MKIRSYFFLTPINFVLAFIAGFRIRIRIKSVFNQGQWIRIRIRNPDLYQNPGGQKRPTKVEKIKKFHVL
jgi:hypothetical protein